MTLSSELAILCGGLSERLGHDKGLYAPLGDEPLVARALRIMAPGFVRMFVVVRDAEQASLYEEALRSHLAPPIYAKTKIIWDDMGEDATSLPRAAMAGVLTTLRFAASAKVAILPVDQIGVRLFHIEKLLDRTGLAAFSDIDGEAMAFPSVWPLQARERVSAAVAAGSLSVRLLQRDLDVELVDGSPYRTELEQNGNTKEALASYFGSPLFDPFGRRLHYLRFSMTEACNLSCTYCLPDGFPEWYRHKARLGEEDIDVLLHGFRSLGFRKLRLTGGEPTVHPGCLKAVVKARTLGFEEIALTTNGLLIGDVKKWKDAGLTSINVSLDSLDPSEFETLTKSKEVAKVRKVIEDAATVGFETKVNAVLIKSVNGSRQSIERLIDWALALPITLRFIELMETGLNSSFSAKERVLGTELMPLLAARGLTQRHAKPGVMRLGGPAEVYEHPDTLGKIGLINPMSCNFCDKCNRLRVTARGRLRLCLFGDNDAALDLSSPESVALNVRNLIGRKPERHYLDEGNHGNVATFRTIGG